MAYLNSTTVENTFKPCVSFSCGLFTAHTSCVMMEMLVAPHHPVSAKGARHSSVTLLIFHTTAPAVISFSNITSLILHGNDIHMTFICHTMTFILPNFLSYNFPYDISHTFYDIRATRNVISLIYFQYHICDITHIYV